MTKRTRFFAALVLATVCAAPVPGDAQITVTNHDGSVWTVFPGQPPEPSGGSQVFTQLASPPVVVPTDPVQQPVPPDPLAPALSGPFDAINFDTDAANTGFYQIPPDPIGAAGPNHLVSVVNSSIEWYAKDGTLQNSQRLGRNSTTVVGSFFASLSPTNGTFDPKVIYDQHAGRFLVVTLERQGNSPGSPTNSSRILLAVSDDSDPNGTWYFLALDSMISLDGTNAWADYPGLAVDEEAVYLTMNMFTFGAAPAFLSSLLWIVNKSPFYTNGTASFTVHDPGDLTGVGSVFTPQPAHVFGASGVASGVGTFLVSSGWADGEGNDFLSVIRVNDPLTSPTFSNAFVSLGGDIHSGAVPDSPQSGTNTLIDAGDERVYHAVWRNDNLYAVNTVNPPSGTDAGQATAHWYQIDTSTLAALSLTDHGNIGGEDIATGTHTYYPAIAVDFEGNVGIGFAASAPTIYPGAYYTGRTNGETAGTVQTAGTLAAGVDYYIRKFTGSRNRWGDYSGISVDPATDSTFWVFNEYALSRGTVFGGEDGRWGTRWGKFTFVNRSPLAANPGLGTRTNLPVTFSAHKLATDPDEDDLTFDVDSPSAGGGTVSLLNGEITYTPPAGFTGTDTFTYSADDGRGGTTNGTVTVTIRNALAVSLNIVSGPVITNGNFVVRFAGIPGRTYTIESAPGATGPWTKADNRTAPTTNSGFGVGVFEFSEATGGDASRFYRTVYPSY